MMYRAAYSGAVMSTHFAARRRDWTSENIDAIAPAVRHESMTCMIAPMTMHEYSM